MKKIRKTLALLLSVIMLCTIANMEIFASDAYGSSFDSAIELYIQNFKPAFYGEGSISTSGEQDYYKFTVPQTGTYIIYTTGTTDTIGTLYDSSRVQIAYNDDNDGTNFGMQYHLTAGKEYYIKVGAYSSKTGSYSIHVDIFVERIEISSNRDARDVYINSCISAYFDSIELHLDSGTNSTIKISKNDQGVNTSSYKGLISWRFTKSVNPTTLGQYTKVYITAKRGNISVTSDITEKGVFYDTSILTGITGSKTNLSSLISSISKPGYTIEAYDSNWSEITDTNIATTTGMVLVTTKNNYIYDVKFVVLFGDVDGNGKVNAKDVIAMQRHIEGSNKIYSDQEFLAGDVNHDGVIDDTDVNLVMQYILDADKLAAAQNYVISTVPSTLYW